MAIAADTRPLPLTELAAVVYIHFARLFRRSTGKSSE